MIVAVENPRGIAGLLLLFLGHRSVHLRWDMHGLQMIPQMVLSCGGLPDCKCQLSEGWGGGERPIPSHLSPHPLSLRASGLSLSLLGCLGVGVTALELVLSWPRQWEQCAYPPRTTGNLEQANLQMCAPGKHLSLFIFSLDQEEAAGCGSISGSQQDRVRGGGHHHVGRTEAVDVQKHSPWEEACAGQPSATSDI